MRVSGMRVSGMRGSGMRNYSASPPTQSGSSSRSPSRGRPSLRQRLHFALSTPGHARSVVFRRTVALILVCAAGIAALSALREHPAVYIFAREVAAGTVLTDADISTRRIPAAVVPATALRPEGIAGAVAPTPADPWGDEHLAAADAAVIGRVVLAAASAGEIITQSRLLGQHSVGGLLPESTQRAHLVPLRLAQPDILSLLHHGDTVDVITAAREEPHQGEIGFGEAEPDLGESTSSITIARGARVVLTTIATEGSSRASTILIALPQAEAAAVAAASLSLPLTVVITGQRASPDSPAS